MYSLCLSSTGASHGSLVRSGVSHGSLDRTGLFHICMVVLTGQVFSMEGLSHSSLDRTGLFQGGLNMAGVSHGSLVRTGLFHGSLDGTGACVILKDGLYINTSWGDVDMVQYVHIQITNHEYK